MSSKLWKSENFNPWINTVGDIRNQEEEGSESPTHKREAIMVEVKKRSTESRQTKHQTRPLRFETRSRIRHTNGQLDYRSYFTACNQIIDLIVSV